jgi:hypothetical protein
MMKYMFKTSLGNVFLSLDPQSFKNGRSTKFSVLSGQECLDKLFHSQGISHIDQIDGSLWAFSELDDPHDGAPEYLLEPVKE